MKVPSMIAAEFRRLTSTTMSMVAVIALALVPILYGGLYLWANQDPYANLNRVPVALVVQDAGATVNGTHVNYGDAVADQIIKDHSFGWHRVSAATAKKGVNDSRYDFSVTLPAGFSEALASAAGANPRTASVVLTTNDANSYLSTTIGQQAVKAIRVAIVQKVNSEAAGQFLVALSDIRTKLTSAADGAGKLAAGSSSAATGAQKLANGTNALASGAAQVAAGNAQLANKADQVGSLAQQATAALPQARQDIAAVLAAQGVGQPTINDVLAQLDPVGTKLAADNAKAQQIVSQIDQLAAGSAQVASGATDAAAGASSLATGLATLTSGAEALHTGLQDGTSAIPATTAASRAKQAAAIADPVTLRNSAVTAAGTYGAGLAPFFASLAAWIGIYALFLIVKPVSKRAITALHSPLKVTLAGWLTPGILGVIQMAGLFLVLSLALGFGMSSPAGVFGIMVLSSLTFTAIILALNVWLGSVGQFVGLVLMVLQLVTAGGTFPWQTLPAPLAALHHVFPMSYSVDAMRQLMYGGNAAGAGNDAIVLLLWLFAGLALAAVGVTRMTHFRTLRDLQPSLIG
jgi:putative membrane protein